MVIDYKNSIVSGKGVGGEYASLSMGISDKQSA